MSLHFFHLLQVSVSVPFYLHCSYLTTQVICADQYTFDVVDGDRNYCVDMALWTCTCRKFQLDQLPCDHVLAVVRKTQYDPYDLCSLYYTREFWCETYRGVIQPIPHISSWVVPPPISTF